MWILERLNGEEKYYLLVGKEYTIGRKSTDILISNDPSISRKHSAISLEHPESHLNNPERLPVLTLKDVGSKYGTYVNNKKVGLEPVILKAGDKVTFGQCDASFQIVHQAITVTSSCVEKEDKEQLKNLIQRLGGHLLPEWSEDCTHLVMKELKVTIKAVCAMVSLKPLVTKDYFESLISCIEESKNLPLPESYVPLLGEPILDRDTATFHCNKERQTIFQNKTFICTSPKQYKKLQLAIKLAGGKAILAGAENEITPSLILHPDTCVMKYQPTSSQTAQHVPYYIERIEDELKRNKKRMIPESDIGLAVVYCSTRQYCNADFNLAPSLFGVGKLQSQTLSQQDVYVEDSQVSTMRSIMERSKSKCGSHVSDTFGGSKHERSFNTEHQDAALNSAEPSNQHGLKRESHFNESEHPSKQVKLQDISIKKEDCSTEGNTNHLALKVGQPEDISKVAVKTEIATPFNNNTTVLEDCWSELSFDYPNQSSSDVKIPTVKEEKRSKSPLTRTSTNVESKLDENQVQQSEERVVLPQPVDGFSSKVSHHIENTTNSDIKEEQIVDENLPSRLLKVEFASLCPKRNSQSRVATNCTKNTNGTIRNFKKFRKVYSTGNKLPVIIGGCDLVVYNKNMSRDFSSQLSDDLDDQSQESEGAGLFDWDSNRAR